jgi:hypothetical protein
MINKINKERRRSMIATPHDPATRASGKEPRRTPNKNRTGHKAKHGTETIFRFVTFWGIY